MLCPASMGPFEGAARGVVSAEGYGYLVTRNYVGTPGSRLPQGTVHVLDLRQPASPRALGEVRIDADPDDGPDFCRGMVYSRAFARSADALYVVDVTIPAHPTLAARLDTAYRRGWVCDGRFAYAPDALGGAVAVLDLSIPAHPRAVGAFMGLANVWMLAGDANTIAVADGRGGLHVLRRAR